LASPSTYPVKLNISAMMHRCHRMRTVSGSQAGGRLPRFCCASHMPRSPRSGCALGKHSQSHSAAPNGGGRRRGSRAEATPSDILGGINSRSEPRRITLGGVRGAAETSSDAFSDIGAEVASTLPAKELSSRRSASWAPLRLRDARCGVEGRFGGMPVSRRSASRPPATCPRAQARLGS
jgi:hypothetical protein